MRLDVAGQTITHHTFRDLPSLLRAGDLLVLNDTRVIPARVLGRRQSTGGKWEGLFLQQVGDAWEMLAKTRGYAQVGEHFEVEPAGLTLTLVGRTSERHWLMRPSIPGTPAEILGRFGQIPLPPYIRKGRAEAEDQQRYQTVYASRPGSVAAPTAGLHFTPALMEQLQQQGISTARVTLHVGLGTFESVTAADPRQHRIHAEWCEVSATTAEAIQRTKDAGGRVIAVGTTSTRTLESAGRGGSIAPYQGPTDLYIHPPFCFRVIDGLITNFHLPRTTLLLLVQSLSGAELLRRAYAEAVTQEYRFFSYGDAMLVL